MITLVTQKAHAHAHTQKAHAHTQKAHARTHTHTSHLINGESLVAFDMKHVIWMYDHRYQSPHMVNTHIYKEYTYGQYNI